MEIYVTKTGDGVKTYPMHKHRHYEVMLYLSGEGYMQTSEKTIRSRPER